MTPTSPEPASSVRLPPRSLDFSFCAEAFCANEALAATDGSPVLIFVVLAVDKVYRALEQSEMDNGKKGRLG